MVFGKGDLVLEFAGHAVFTVDDLHRLLTDEAAGRDLEVKVLRQAKIEFLTVPDIGCADSGMTVNLRAGPFVFFVSFVLKTPASPIQH